MSEDNKKERSKTFKEYSQFLDTHLAKPERAKLSEVSPLASFDEEIRDILSTFYEHPETNIQKLGSAFNAIYTQQNNVFTLSHRIMNELVGIDSQHHGFKSCDDKAFNDIIHRVLSGGIFERIREPVRQSVGTKGKPGLYKLVHPKFLNPLIRLMGKDLADARESRYISWWDKGLVLSNEEKEKDLTPEQRRAREIADDIFKRK